jgi:hypothetical protein
MSLRVLPRHMQRISGFAGVKWSSTSSEREADGAALQYLTRRNVIIMVDEPNAAST